MPTVNIAVKGARNLLAADADGKSDPYVVILCDQQKFKTKVVKSNLNPEWDEQFTIPLTTTGQRLKVEVFDKDKIGSDDSLGTVELTFQGLTQGQEKDAWYILEGGAVGENAQAVALHEAKGAITGMFSKKKKGGVGKSLTSGAKTLATGKSKDIKIKNKGELHIGITAVDFSS
eukprot:TRINITY_DN2061_c0_g1_i1.p2 TRINITY_DN2061_c0_g1~~TRINITY_DN2061_c0_g1_i1.p2  ORF type:complete len:184 (-),score=76.44 TRINITY_DN2061_c0_g1_i1:216-737(-)